MNKCKYILNQKFIIKNFSFILKIFLIFRSIKTTINLCNRETPILLNNETCISFCSKDQFSSQECIIDNDIIKNQWLNNIITLGKEYSTYNNFAQYSNGDLVVLFQDDKGSNVRYFFGLKQNGRPFFNNSDNEETLFYLIKGQDFNNLMLDREVSIIKTNLNNEEYIINIQKDKDYVEVFDFSNNKIYKKISSELFGYPICNYRGIPLNIKENNQTYFLLGSLIYNVNNKKNNYFFILQKLIFDTKESIEIDSDCLKFNSTKIEAYGDTISCFETKLKNIICFYTYFKNISNEFEKQYVIIAFDNNLIMKNIIEEIPATDSEYQIFFKCIHYKDEAGAFIYYKTKEESEELYPTFFFKNISSSGFINSFPEISEIIISPYIFQYFTLLNDFIKLSENNFIFSATDKEKFSLFIVMINIFQNNGNMIKIRIYKINTYNLYNYWFYRTIRLHSFNNGLVLASSFCYQENCKEDQLHYSSLIFFSYPNSTDINVNIIDEFFENNLLTLDIKTNIVIENNIFGYIFSGILIKKFENCENINFVSSTKYININPIYKISKNENIIVKLNFVNFESFNCKIEYSYEITESDFDEFEKYPVKIDNSHGDDKDIFNEKKHKYIGRTSYYNLYLNESLRPDCFDNNCGLCSYDRRTCIICKYNFIVEFDKKGNTQKRCSEYGKKICSTSDILKNNCFDGSMTNEQFNELYKYIKEVFLNNETYYGQNAIFLTENVAFQISTVDSQKNNNNNGISSIDLGECEKKLKKYYSINKDESLIIYKQDIRTDNLATTYVLYNIFHPYTLQPLNLSICSEDKISLSVPVKLKDQTLSLYTSLNESGYNLFDSNDSFYNDICTPYTTENGTDIILIDRKEIIVEIGNDMNLCQKGCKLKSYDLKTNRAICICYIQINGEEFLNFNNLESENFIDDLVNTLKYSNYLVMKCYKLIFQSKYIKKNFGFIFMIIILICFLILVLIYTIKGRKKIDYFINLILKKKDDNKNKINYNKKIWSTKTVTIKDIKKIKNEKNKKPHYNERNKTDYNEKIMKHKKKESEFQKYLKTQLIINSRISGNFEPPLKKKKSKEESFKANKRDDKILTISYGELISTDNKNRYNNLNINSIKEENLHFKRANWKNKTSIIKSNKFKINIHKIYDKKKKLVKYNKNNDNSYVDNNNYQNLNDQELNILDYEIAIKLDKRTFFQYYYSLLKKKQLIMFTFLPSNDYNLIVFKIILFLMALSLCLIVNAFFFSSKKMHEIYKSNGKYNIILKIPQLLYSSLISTFINLILRTLSLSENGLLAIKKQKSLQSGLKKAKKVRTYLRIKFIVFICLSLVLIIFFWYYLSCFCAIYANTQVILIKDSLASLALSMAYPFGLCLIPGFFRISALRAKNHDKEGIYKFSKILSLL